MAELSLTDIYLIQPLLRKFSYDEIAEIINKPVDLIKDYSDRFVKDKNIISKQSLIDKKADRKKRKSIEVQRERENDKAREKAIKARKTAYKSAQFQESGRKEKTYETRHEDLSKKICVRVDHKTTIFVNPGTDIEEFKRKFIEKRDSAREALKPKKTYTEVKKFKPLK